MLLLADSRKVSRRRLLYLAGVGLLGACLIGRELLKRAPASLNAKNEETILSFLDVLIPKDDFAGARETGVGAKLIERASSDGEYAKLLESGARWLNDAAGHRAFSKLTQYDRETIVGKAASLPETHPAGRFFRTVRDDAFRAYYSHPGNWNALGFAGPPQPMGFPDYTGPPNRV